MTLRQILEARISNESNVFREVAGAASLDAILKGRMASPGCYLFNERDNAGANQVLTIVSQRVVKQIAVVTVVGNVRSSSGADSSDESEAVRDVISGLLLGHIPSPEHEAIEFVGGGLVTFINGLYVWKDTYRTANQIRSSL